MESGASPELLRGKASYGRLQRGASTGVAGMDQEFPIPEHADLVIDNEGSEAALLQHADALAALITNPS